MWYNWKCCKRVRDIPSFQQEKMEDVVSNEEMVDADASTNEAVDTDEEAQHKIVVKLERARMSVLN